MYDKWEIVNYKSYLFQSIFHILKKDPIKKYS